MLTSTLSQTPSPLVKTWQTAGWPSLAQWTVNLNLHLKPRTTLDLLAVPKTGCFLCPFRAGDYFCNGTPKGHWFWTEEKIKSTQAPGNPIFSSKWKTKSFGSSEFSPCSQLPPFRLADWWFPGGGGRGSMYLWGLVLPEPSNYPEKNMGELPLKKVGFS